MEVAMSELWGPFIEEIPAFLDDLGNNLGTSTAEFIQSGEPSSITGKLAQASERQACRQWARGQAELGPRDDAFRREVCRGYLEDIDEWPGEGEASEPEFEGGQCPGVRYRVFTSSVSTVGVGTLNPDGTGCGSTQSGETNPTDVLLGPIRGLRRVVTGPASETSSFVRYDLVCGNGTFSTGAIIEGPSCPSSGKVITSVVPFDSGPDECGDPPGNPINPPPIGPPLDGPSVPPGSPPNFQIPVDVEINPDGTINIDIGGEGGTYDPNPEPESENPGGSGEPGDSGDTGEGGDESGEDEGRILVGIRVQMLTTPPKAYVVFSGSKALHQWPYTVYMGGDGGLELDTETSWAAEDAFYHAPEEANRYSVSAKPGYNLRVTPYWREPR